eukprot:359561-Chlamydomonas_euryale.AAC.2
MRLLPHASPAPCVPCPMHLLPHASPAPCVPCPMRLLPRASLRSHPPPRMWPLLSAHGSPAHPPNPLKLPPTETTTPPAFSLPTYLTSSCTLHESCPPTQQPTPPPLPCTFSSQLLPLQVTATRIFAAAHRPSRECEHQLARPVASAGDLHTCPCLSDSQVADVVLGCGGLFRSVGWEGGWIDYEGPSDSVHALPEGLTFARGMGGWLAWAQSGGLVVVGFVRWSDCCEPDLVVWLVWAHSGGLVGVGPFWWFGWCGPVQVVWLVWARSGGLVGVGPFWWSGWCGPVLVVWLVWARSGGLVGVGQVWWSGWCEPGRGTSTIPIPKWVRPL